MNNTIFTPSFGETKISLFLVYNILWQHTTCSHQRIHLSFSKEKLEHIVQLELEKHLKTCRYVRKCETMRV